MTISELVETCKRYWGREVYTALLIVIVGCGAFGLGRLSVVDHAKKPLKFLNSGVEAASLSDSTEVGQSSEFIAKAKAEVAPKPTSSAGAQAGAIVASKSGTKYHFPWCAGAKQMSEKNKIWFASESAARAAGYSPASNCKGLK